MTGAFLCAPQWSPQAFSVALHEVRRLHLIVMSKSPAISPTAVEPFRRSHVPVLIAMSKVQAHQVSDDVRKTYQARLSPIAPNHPDQEKLGLSQSTVHTSTALLDMLGFPNKRGVTPLQTPRLLFGHEPRVAVMRCPASCSQETGTQPLASGNKESRRDAAARTGKEKVRPNCSDKKSVLVLHRLLFHKAAALGKRAVR